MHDLVGSIGASVADHDGTDGASLVKRLTCCVEKTRRGFERWEDPHRRGPGLYFVVERDSVTAFVESMGTNRWPVEDCPSVFGSLDALFEATQKVAFACDGAIVVHDDGTIEEDMVRLKQLSPPECERLDELSYAGWMGARHMSALETSTREEVLAVITLSEEDGRMTVFTDGAFEDHPLGAFSEEGERL